MSMMMRRRGDMARRRDIIEVQQVNATGNSTSPSVTLSAVPAGQHIVAVLGCGSNSLAQVANPAGFTTSTELGTGSAVVHRQAWKQAAGGETTIAFTLTNPGQWRLTVYVFHGMAPSPVDQVDTTLTASTTTLALGATGATSQADELAIAGYFTNAATGGSEAADNGFTYENTSTQSGLATKVLTATGAVSVNFTWATPRTAIGSLVTYKSAS